MSVAFCVSHLCVRKFYQQDLTLAPSRAGEGGQAYYLLSIVVFQHFRFCLFIHQWLLIKELTVQVYDG